MPISNISVEAFVELANTIPVLDVRSPGEFQHAHIPGAISFPLFTNEERKEVGTAYKQQSREQAIKIGLVFFGPRMVQMVEQAEEISKNNGGSKQLLVHCWRGGMRSAAVAWLLSLYGFEIQVLNGGYKQFRHWVLQQFQLDYSFKVIGGYTGSGKTFVLEELKKSAQPIIDLEGLANHKGSAFGGINMQPQPSQEMFENLLAIELFKIKAIAGKEGIWVEDESQRIGRLNIPITTWNLIRNSPVFFLEIEFEKRLQHIISGYAAGDKEKLVNAIIRIQKRLGGLETKAAINHLIDNDFKSGFGILLHYYDKLYTKGLHSRDNLDTQLIRVPFHDVEPAAIAKKLLTEAGIEKTQA